MDDTHTRRFQVAFSPLGEHTQPYEWAGDEDYPQPGPWNDYFRDYEGVDTISGIPGNAPGTNVKGFLVQDNMVNETQGPIVDRRKEHLGAHDHVLTRLRRLMLDAIASVERGQDPPHVIRDSRQNAIVRVVGEDPLERA